MVKLPFHAEPGHLTGKQLDEVRWILGKKDAARQTVSLGLRRFGTERTVSIELSN
jgi:hypothetical protein